MISHITRWIVLRIPLASRACAHLQEMSSSTLGTVNILLRKRAYGDNIFRSNRFPPLMAAVTRDMTPDKTLIWRIRRYPSRDRPNKKTQGSNKYLSSSTRRTYGHFLDANHIMLNETYSRHEKVYGCNRNSLASCC